MLNAFVQMVLLPAWILNEALAKVMPGNVECVCADGAAASLDPE